MISLPAILRVFGKQRVGVALGSGGSKGIAHISVLEFIDSLGIPVHMISGSSIGAFVGAIYSVGALKKLKEDLLKMKRLEMLPYFDPVFPKSGILGGKKVMEFMRRYIPVDTRIENMQIPLGVVATDLGTGRAVVFKSGNLLDALRASISIPGIFEPVRYRDRVLSLLWPVNISNLPASGNRASISLMRLVPVPLFWKSGCTTSLPT